MNDFWGKDNGFAFGPVEFETFLEHHVGNISEANSDVRLKCGRENGQSV